MPQLRQNIITGEWVVIAPERAKRPTDFVTKRPVRTDDAASCPFCQSRPNGHDRGNETEHVYVIPNKYPAFVEDASQCSPRSFKTENGFYTTKPSTGGHDVLVIKDHATSLTGFSEAIWTDLFSVTRARVEHFYRSKNVLHAMPIYNHRAEAGASIAHPHAQLFAANVVPNQIARELAQTEEYFSDNGSCAFCDLIVHETREKVRLLYESETFIAFTCYAARFPFETWILPKSHAAKFEDVSAQEIGELAHTMRTTVGLLDAALDDPPLNYFIHTLPSTIEDARHYHWHLEIAPRLTNYGGYELGSGMVIDVMSPELAAQHLKAPLHHRTDATKRA